MVSTTRTRRNASHERQPVNDAFREMYNIQARPQVFDDVKPEETKVEPAPAEAEAGTKEPGIAAA